MKTIMLFGWAIVVMAALGGCGAADESAWPRLRLIVSEEARPVTPGLEASLEEFKRRIGVAVDVEVVSASQVLARLEGTAPADLVLTCEPALIGEMTKRGLAGPERWLLERRRDRVALVARRDDPTTLSRLEELGGRSGMAVGITRHEKSNVGMVADMKLRRLGLLPKMEGRMRIYDSQAELVRGLERGEVRVGFIRETALEAWADEVKTLFVFDPMEEVFPPYLALAVNRRSGQGVRARQCWSALEMFCRNPVMFLIDASEAGGMFGLENLAT